MLRMVLGTEARAQQKLPRICRYKHLDVFVPKVPKWNIVSNNNFYTAGGAATEGKEEGDADI